MKKDFKIRYTRGSGPGGQHKNKVETCVVITHVPTGLREKCEDTRSRARNEKIAMGRLLKRIKELEEEAGKKARSNQRKAQIQGKRTLRTYNYARNEVIDHSTDKRANLRRVLDGEIDLLKQ